jgi:hypothetical protein
MALELFKSIILHPAQHFADRPYDAKSGRKDLLFHAMLATKTLKWKE